MAVRVVLALDQGTTSTRAVAYALDGTELATAQQELAQSFPQPGWVEHDPEMIWATALATLRRVLASVPAGAAPVGLGVTNQRETTLLWHRKRNEAVAPAIVWQDRRTAGRCAALAAAGHEREISARTGLTLDPYFSATKLAYLLETVPGARAAAEAGALAFGTVDSWLLWRLTGGAVHATDASNAARTMLFNIDTQAWDARLLDLFDIPPACLPEVRDTVGFFGETDPAWFGQRIAVLAVAGDQQAALAGQACWAAGDAKCTYGTGAFLMLNTGTVRKQSAHRLLSTVAWREAGETVYALEGAILSAGATIQWLRDGLGMITRAAEIEPLAASVPDAGGVVLIPAFTGLGAPFWNPEARAAIVGVTRGTTRGHIARAALEAAAHQTADLLEAMYADGMRPAGLRVDGGMAANNLFLQILADTVQLPIHRTAQEATARGAAFLAARAAGHDLPPAAVTGRFLPEREVNRSAWQSALAVHTHP